MDRPALIVVYYLTANLSIVIAHKTGPTSLAGPGLDLVLYLILFLLSLGLIMQCILQKINYHKSLYPKLLLHLMGLASLVLLAMFS